MNRYLKTAFIIGLCLVVFVSCSGCVDIYPENRIDITDNTDGKWLISDYKNAVAEDTDVSYKDDFHLAVNKDWILDANLLLQDPMYINNSLARDNEQRMITAITDSQYVGSEDEKMSILMSQILDRDERNRVGLIPIVKGAQEIMDIETTDDIKAYLSTHPDTGLMYVNVESDPFKNGYCVSMSNPQYSIPTIDSYETLSFLGDISIPDEAEDAYQFYLTMAEGVGIPHEDITILYTSQLYLEKKLAEAQKVDEDKVSESASIYDQSVAFFNPITVDELKAMKFPAYEIVHDFVDAGATNFVVSYPTLLDTYENLFTENNVNGFKSMLLYGYFIKYAPYLNDTAYNAYNKLYNVGDVVVDKQTALQLIENISPFSLSKVYADNYMTAEGKSLAEWLVKQYISAYKEYINTTSWASDELKEKALEKLDNIQSSVGYPDWTIYGLDNLKIGDTDLISNVNACDEALLKYLVNKSLLTTDSPDAWISQNSLVYTVNAFYDHLSNSIVVPAGIFGGTYFDIDADIEENLAGLGFVIGHELSHSLDNQGSYFDKKGNFSNWWTEKDIEEYSKRLERLIDYYSQLKIFGKEIDGERIASEAMADITGLGASLLVASYIPDFDYQKFFKAYARGWALTGSLLSVFNSVENDEHPLNYLRTNVAVQQYDQFNTAFDVSKNDNMYLSPDKRLIIWGT